MRRPLLTLSLIAALATGCSGPILANAPAPRAVVPTARPTPIAAPDPQPIVFPRDSGPHDRLTEWWYYTGHLRDAAGGRWGFEFVIFRAERGGFPVTWASHLAITDEVAGSFRYDQRTEIGPQVDQSAQAGPLRLVIGDPAAPATTATFPTAFPTAAPSGGPMSTTWLMAGEAERLVAATDGGRLGIDLTLNVVPGVPPVLHNGNGWVDFGPAGGSYYYSRPRVPLSGTLLVDGTARPVEGTAWFDHQWGNFISVGGGGWDWFAVNLDDGTDLTISLVRAADGSMPLVYGTLADAFGATRNLDRTDFEVTADAGRTWTSPATGATYPAGWTIRIPGDGLEIRLAPTVADQELDTRATTGVVYWEGSQIVSATRDGVAVGGEAYVELTGYAPTAP
ncbi:MAG: lipocalin family protein [Chloroflexota bacterium]